MNMTTPVGPPADGTDTNSTHIIPRDDDFVERDGSLVERGLPSSVDWRNRGGLNWLTSIQVSLVFFKY